MIICRKPVDDADGRWGAAGAVLDARWHHSMAESIDLTGDRGTRAGQGQGRN